MSTADLVVHAVVGVEGAVAQADGPGDRGVGGGIGPEDGNQAVERGLAAPLGLHLPVVGLDLVAGETETGCCWRFWPGGGRHSRRHRRRRRLAVLPAAAAGLCLYKGPGAV